MTRRLALAATFFLACGGKAVLDGGGAVPQDCDGLHDEYERVLDQARACDLNVDEPQCTEAVDDRLSCSSCTTYVNTTQSAHLAKLDQLAKRYLDLDCDADCIGGVSCANDPTGAVCSSDGAICVDQR